MKNKLLLTWMLAIIGLSSNAQWTAMTNGLPTGTVFYSFVSTSGTTIFTSMFGVGVFRSTDDGISWTAVNTGLTNSGVLSLASSGTNIFAGTLGGGVFLSTNNGNSWTAVNTGLTNHDVLTLAISGTNIFAGTDSSGVFLSTNNGSSWAAVNTGLPATVGIYSLAISGANIFAAGTLGFGMYLSTNNGNSWATVNTGLTAPLHFSLAISGSTVFAGTNDGVFSSVNNGTLWTASGLTGLYVRSFVKGSTNIIFAGTDAGVYLSTNNGNSWTAENTGFPGGTADIYSLGISSTNIFAGSDTAGWKRALSQVIGIDESTMGNAESNVYPNPFSTSTTIQINSAFKIQNAELCIYDLLGVEVKRVNHIFAHEIKLNRDNLPSGVYFIQVRNNEQTITRKILISQ